MPLTSKEKELLIEKIKELYDDENVHDKWNNSGEYRGGFDDGVMEAIRIIQAVPEQAENTQALIKLRDKVKDWWDCRYPDDIFPKEIEGVDNEDRDAGVRDIVEIRKLIKVTESEVGNG